MVAFCESAKTGAVPANETDRQELKTTIWRKKFIGSIDLISRILPSFAECVSELVSIV